MVVTSFRVKVLGVLAMLMMVSVYSFGQTPTKSRQQKINQKTDSVKQEIKNQGKESIHTVKNPLPDSVPSIKNEVKRAIPKRPDSVGVSFENGKWNLPKGQKPSTDILNQKDPSRSLEDAGKNLSVPDLKNVTDLEKIKQQNVPDLVKLKEKNRPAELDRRLKQADSIQKRAKTVEQDILNATEKIPDVQQVMSLKAIRKLYDSLGISRLDSIRALANLKEDVSPEDLAQALKLSFPSRPGFFNDEKFNPMDMAKTEAAKDMKVPDLGSMKLSPDAIGQLPAIRGMQLPDSIPMLDSLQKLNLMRQKLTLNENEFSDNIKTSLLKQKPRFWDRTYLEGIFSYAKDQDVDVIQASPALGYHFNESLSIGFGPSILIQVKEKKVNTMLGYRSFAKYEFLVLKQIGYLHVEDQVDPKSYATDNTSGTRHSILAGVGFIVPIAKSIGVNLCTLYRVNNENYSAGNISPWVVRIGLSSIRSKKLKSNE